MTWRFSGAMFFARRAAASLSADAGPHRERCNQGHAFEAKTAAFHSDRVSESESAYWQSGCRRFAARRISSPPRPNVERRRDLRPAHKFCQAMDESRNAAIGRICSDNELRQRAMTTSRGISAEQTDAAVGPRGEPLYIDGSVVSQMRRAVAAAGPGSAHGVCINSRCTSTCRATAMTRS